MTVPTPTPVPSPDDPAIGRVYANIRLIAQIIREMENLMPNMADLLAKLATLQTGQVESLKDVRRLIADGDTTAAISAVDALIATNEELDAEVEAASPEPTVPPVTPTEPTPAGGTPDFS
jgi:hypothetical protein